MRVDTLWSGAHLATMAPAGDGLGLIPGGAVAARDGRIVYAGPEAEMPALAAAERSACEGRLVAVVPAETADHAVEAMRAHPLGREAAVIGRVRSEQPGLVQLKTAFGGTRIVDLLVGDPLPRIC